MSSLNFSTPENSENVMDTPEPEKMKAVYPSILNFSTPETSENLMDTPEPEKMKDVHPSILNFSTPETSENLMDTPEPEEMKDVHPSILVSHDTGNISATHESTLVRLEKRMQELELHCERTHTSTLVTLERRTLKLEKRTQELEFSCDRALHALRMRVLASAAQLCSDTRVDDQQNVDTLTADVARGVDAAGSKHEGSYRNWPEYALMMRDLEEAISRFWQNLEAKAAALSLAVPQEALQRESALAAKHWQMRQVNASEERLARLEEPLPGESGETPAEAKTRTVPSFPCHTMQEPHHQPSFAHDNLIETQTAATVASAFAEAAEVSVVAEADAGLPLDKAAIRAVHAEIARLDTPLHQIGRLLPNHRLA
jgi:hypothetical protein